MRRDNAREEGRRTFDDSLPARDSLLRWPAIFFVAPATAADDLGQFNLEARLVLYGAFSCFRIGGKLVQPKQQLQHGLTVASNSLMARVSRPLSDWLRSKCALPYRLIDLNQKQHGTNERR